MKKVLLITLLIVVFAAGTALAFGGLGGGPKLKKETKTMALGEASAALKPYEGGELAPEAVEYVQIGDADFDSLAKSLAKMEIILAFGNNVIADTNAKLDAVETQDDLDALNKNVAAATAAAAPLVAEATKMVSAATSLLSNLKKKLMTNPMLLKEVMSVLDQAKKIGGELDKLLENLGTLTEKVKAKATELAGQAADAAAEATE